MKPVTSLYLFLVISFMLTCCAPSFPKLTQSLIPTQLSSPNIVSTFFPTLTATITPPSTLEPKQAEEVISQLLKESVDCAAPCFWGITPGFTNLDKAEEIINHFGLHLEEIRTESNQVFYYASYRFSNNLSIDLRLTVKGEMVIEIRAYITPEVLRQGVPREWLSYSPETLIKRYGNPSRVDIYLSRGAPAVLYDMVLYFDNVNLIIEYSSYDITFERNLFRICPIIDQPDSIRIWLGKQPTDPPLEGVQLEKATSMTMEEFLKVMKGIPDKACIYINAEIFP